MPNEIDIISDRGGITRLGDPTAVDRFLSAQDLPSKPMDVSRVSGSASHAVTVGIVAAGQISARSGGVRFERMLPDTRTLA